MGYRIDVRILVMWGKFWSINAGFNELSDNHYAGIPILDFAQMWEHLLK